MRMESEARRWAVWLAVLSLCASGACSGKSDAPLGGAGSSSAGTGGSTGSSSAGTGGGAGSSPGATGGSGGSSPGTSGGAGAPAGTGGGAGASGGAAGAGSPGGSAGAGGSSSPDAAGGGTAQDAGRISDGGATSDGGGACTNSADQVILSNDMKFDQVSTDCGTMCFFSLGDKKTCASNCLQMQGGLSAGCAACYGGHIACGMETCSAACLANSASMECRNCVAQNCDPTLRACAGDPPPGG